MRRRFSERLGYNNQIPSIQIEGMNDSLRNSLWNYIHALYEDSHNWDRLATRSARFFWKIPVDEVPAYEDQCRQWIKEQFYKMPWYEVYDLVEFVAAYHENIIQESRPYGSQKFEKNFNYIFERELSGYRFISGVIVPITNSEEINGISESIELTKVNGLEGAHEHLQTALTLLGKRPKPEYRNAIKESISAVESISKQISGSSSQGLSGALEELSKTVSIHGALKSGFIKLYGYTSDESGIRHAILEEPNVGFDEAKYMIVSCSAFVNYLITKAEKSGLLST